MKEEWRRIPGWPDYEVSNLGRVRHHVIKVLKSWASGDKYPSVCLPRGQRKYIHRLVLEAFAGPPNGGQEARHLDGNRGNARLDNLTWGSRSENQADRVRHGTSNRGARCGTSKLNDYSVAEIRRKYDIGEATQRELASEFHVSLGLINAIVHRTKWVHVWPFAHEVVPRQVPRAELVERQYAHLPPKVVW